MNIENDPRLTAYALGELGDAERHIFEQELANAGGAHVMLNEFRACAERIREAFAAEPSYAMTAEQRANLLASAGALPVPVAIETVEFNHSDKVLPWVTQPVISEIDKQKIAEALKPTLWRRVVPMIGSLGVAAGFVWLATVVLMQEQPEGVAKEPDTGVEEVAAAPEITVWPAGSFSKEDWRKRRGADNLAGLPPYRYGQTLPRKGLPDRFDHQKWLADGGMRDPAYEGFRRSVLPVVVSMESYETLRRFMLAGMLPPVGEVRVGELLNAFQYGYPAPVEGETFAVDTEVASCPWDPGKQLLQIGVRATESEPESTVAEGVRMEVEFNPATVEGYRLIGENEKPDGLSSTEPPLATVAAGHTVTALYELVPRADGEAPPAGAGLENPAELVTVRVDYKDTGADAPVQTLQATVAEAENKASWREASDDMRFAASVAGFGLLLGADEGKPLATYDLVLELARDAVGDDPDGRRQEFVEWIEKTIELKAEASANEE